MIIQAGISITTILSSILFGGVLLCVIKYHWQRRWLYYYGFKINGPFGFPLLGSFHCFLKGRDGLCDKIMEISERYKPIGKVWMGQTLFVGVTRPEHVELLLKRYLNKGQHYELIQELLGDGLLITKAEKWKRHRKCINLTFTQANLNSYVDIFVKYANNLIDDLTNYSENNQIDIYSKFGECTLGIILETSMGVHPSEFSEQYLSWLTRAAELTIVRFYNPLLYLNSIWRISSASKEISYICTKIWNYVRKIVDIKRRENKTKASNRRIFLDHLIKVTDEEGKWTEEELMEETQTMVATGSDTTATTLSFVMLMLAMHHEIQEKVYDELSEIFQGTNRDVNLKDLDRMTYLEQVIKETMRLFPIAPILLRSAHEHIDLGSHVIPKGSTLFVPIIYIHRDPNVWHDPLKFNPDRFLPEEVAKRHRHSYMPFSIPPRDCIGKKYAMMSMKAILSTIIRRYKVISSEYKSVKDIHLYINVVVMATRGYKVTLKCR